ncbi:hypothetical protein [Mycobacteroides abscessus]|uniref:hypothetical protein n=1 Tax=Mycobacteroides abscessus TaxID=36809 RepID=UPI00044D6D25|nr:hypothetical protein [Mycobacteroides abscessus]EUA85019.1 hypothetical protein I544_5465 [Mycobacteroides abscessus subsp. bolletii 103]
MSDNETTEDKAKTEVGPGEATDFIVVLAAHDKGRAQLKASKLLAQCVEAAHVTGKKGGTNHGQGDHHRTRIRRCWNRNRCRRQACRGI